MAAKYIGRHHHHVPSANASSAHITTSTNSGSGSPSGSSAVEFSEPLPAAAAAAAHGSYSPPANELPPPQPGAALGQLCASELIPLMESEKPLVVDLAVTSAEELLHVAQAGHPLWVMTEDLHHHHHHFSSDDISIPSTFNGRSEAIDHETYFQRFPRAGVFGPTPPGMKLESSRFTGLVIMNSISLVETLMDVVSCFLVEKP